jgi:hypothetical protein
MPTYVASPGGAGPWPGVVVIHDFTGMSHDLRNQANWLADEGYLAAAPDLYYWGSRLRCLWTIMREIPSLRAIARTGIPSARCSRRISAQSSTFSTPRSSRGGSGFTRNQRTSFQPEPTMIKLGQPEYRRSRWGRR